MTDLGRHLFCKTENRTGQIREKSDRDLLQTNGATTLNGVAAFAMLPICRELELRKKIAPPKGRRISGKKLLQITSHTQEQHTKEDGDHADEGGKDDPVGGKGIIGAEFPRHNIGAGGCRRAEDHKDTDHLYGVEAEHGGKCQCPCREKKAFKPGYKQDFLFVNRDIGELKACAQQKQRKGNGDIG